MRLVKVLETIASKIKHEIFKDDIAQDRIFSVVECVPIKDQKVLKLKLEGGETIIIPGEILSTSLNPGEKKLKATDENGNEKISITLYADGKITIQGGTQEMVAVLSSAFQNMIDYEGLVNDILNGFATATIPTALGGTTLAAVYPAFAVKYPQAVNKKTSLETDKSNLDTFKK